MASDTIKRNLIAVNHEFTSSLTSGSIGQRCAQLSFTSPYPASKLVGIVITAISDSNGVNPLVFVNGETIYCNFYRASTSAANATVWARMVYES